jgi:hypothetical protein
MICSGRQIWQLQKVLRQVNMLQPASSYTDDLQRLLWLWLVVATQSLLRIWTFIASLTTFTKNANTGTLWWPREDQWWAYQHNTYWSRLSPKDCHSWQELLFTCTICKVTTILHVEVTIITDSTIFTWSRCINWRLMVFEILCHFQPSKWHKLKLFLL